MLARAAPSPAGSGNAWSPVVRTVEIGEVLVAEQLVPVQSEEAVEGVSPHVIQVGVLATV
jgi:hypothetical protein